MCVLAQVVWFVLLDTTSWLQVWLCYGIMAVSAAGVFAWHRRSLSKTVDSVRAMREQLRKVWRVVNVLCSEVRLEF